MSAILQSDDDIRLIRDSTAAVAPPGGDLRRIRALRFSQPGFDPAVWQQICALGWPGLLVAESAGGSGLGMRAFCALAEELGAGLVPEPLIGAALAARLLRGDDLAAHLTGAKLVLPAWQERENTLVPGDACRFTEGRVSGTKRFIPMAAGADAFVVTTPDGVVLVDRAAKGVQIEIAGTQDGGHFGALFLQDTPCRLVAGVTAAEVSAALDEATLATAAALLGVMERAFAITLDYLRTRQQFGRPIGSFQGLQHRAADLKVQIALTRASVEAAAVLLDAGGASRAAVSRAKARACDAALLVTRQAVQLHGGIGYTDEYDIGLFLRKAMVLANLYGSAALHRARFAAETPEDEDI